MLTLVFNYKTHFYSIITTNSHQILAHIVDKRISDFVKPERFNTLFLNQTHCLGKPILKDKHLYLNIYFVYKTFACSTLYIINCLATSLKLTDVFNFYGFQKIIKY